MTKSSLLDYLWPRCETKYDDIFSDRFFFIQDRNLKKNCSPLLSEFLTKYYLMVMSYNDIKVNS